VSAIRSLFLLLLLGACSDGPGVECSEGACGGDCPGQVVSTDGGGCRGGGSGNTSCLDGCTPARCGNGVVDKNEECDDGNARDTDACLNTCMLARCGDGVVHQGEEACDYGENNLDAASAACRSDCMAPRCGDGIVDSSEECDDGNNIDDDGCDADCSFPDVVQLVTGLGNNCALFDAGNVRCWGANRYGQLGYGHTELVGDDEPAGAFGDVAIGGRVVQLAMGASHTCALLESGNVRCWGEASYGQLGPVDMEVYGRAIGDEPGEMPPPDLPTGGKAVRIFAGPSRTCVLLDDGDVRCWGTPVNDHSPSPEDVDSFGALLDLAFGWWHACGMFETGNVRCWSYAFTGYHGYGTTAPVAVHDAWDVDIGGTVVQIASSYEHTCALLDTGAVHCWGNGEDGRLGYGNGEWVGDDETPRQAGAVDLGEPVVQVAAGASHTCAVLASGGARCWGELWQGQLGYGDLFPRGAALGIGDEPGEMPPPYVNVGGTVVQLVAGSNHTCALLAHGRVRCWGGRGYFYMLGYGRDIDLDEPPASAGDVPLYVK